MANLLWYVFFFFKQKTAYDMRISDWSSDVCSSDLIEAPAPRPSPTPVLPSVWGRSEIVGLAVAASDALTSGKPLPDLANQAVGQRLDLVIPFGCAGPAGESSHAPLRWRYDAQDRALRVHVEPTQWSGADWSLGKEQRSEEHTS